MKFVFQVGSCNTIDCNDPYPGVDNVTIRASAFAQKVSPASLGCSGTFARVTGSFCVTPVDPADTTDIDYSTEFNVYTDATTSSVRAKFYPNFAPARVQGLVYPNLMSFPTVSAIIDCRGQPTNQNVRVAWLSTTGGPCYQPAGEPSAVCVTEGIINNNANFLDADGNALPEGAIWATANCPAW